MDGETDERYPGDETDKRHPGGTTAANEEADEQRRDGRTRKRATGRVARRVDQQLLAGSKEECDRQASPTVLLIQLPGGTVFVRTLCPHPRAALGSIRREDRVSLPLL